MVLQTLGLGRREFQHWLQSSLLTAAGWSHWQEPMKPGGIYRTGAAWWPRRVGVRWELGKLLGQSTLKMFIPCSSSCSDLSDPTKPQGPLSSWDPN